MKADKQGFMNIPLKIVFAVTLVLLAAGFGIAIRTGPEVWPGLVIQDSVEGPESEAAQERPETDDSAAAGLPEDNLKSGGTVEVLGFEPMTDSVCLALRLEEIPAFRIYPGFNENMEPDVLLRHLEETLKQVHFIDQDGREYHYRGGNFVAEHQYSAGCAAGVTWSTDLLLELPGIDENAETLTLVVPLSEGEEFKKEIPLALLRQIGECRLPGVRITW